MRKFIFLLLGISIHFISFSQEYQSVIYLKNGSVIKGEIITQEPNIIIRTSDGQLYSFSSIEIEQILQEQNLNLSEYGSNFSYGISFGGGGIIGVPIRFHPSEKFAFEMNLNYRPAEYKKKNYWGDTKTYYEHSIIYGLGAKYFIGKYFKEKRQKVKLNGISLNAGIGMGGFETLYAGGGWIHESFKNKRYKKSFTLELGPGFIYTHFNPSDLYDDSSYDYYELIFHWKVQWNWFK